MKISSHIQSPSARLSAAERNNQQKKATSKSSSHNQSSKSVGAIVINPRGHILLIFQQLNKYWEFPKGKVESGERELDTLQREIYEETGIKHYELIANFRRSMFYDFHYKGQLIRRKVVYFLIETRDRVRISDEHMRYAWLPIEKAKKRLKHQTQRDLLDEVKIIHEERIRARKLSVEGSSTGTN